MNPGVGNFQFPQVGNFGFPLTRGSGDCCNAVGWRRRTTRRLGQESPLLAALVSASVQGRVALGAPAGRRVPRFRDEANAEGRMARGPQAHLEGFDLHANV